MTGNFCSCSGWQVFFHAQTWQCSVDYQLLFISMLKYLQTAATKYISHLYQTSFHCLHTEAASSGLWENVKLHKTKMSTYQIWFHLNWDVWELGVYGELTGMLWGMERHPTWDQTFQVSYLPYLSILIGKYGLMQGAFPFPQHSFNSPKLPIHPTSPTSHLSGAIFGR